MYSDIRCRAGRGRGDDNRCAYIVLPGATFGGAACRGRPGLIANEFPGFPNQLGGRDAGSSFAAAKSKISAPAHGRGALFHELQPLSSGTLSHRAHGRAMEDDHAAHAGTGQFARLAVQTHPEIFAGQQRPLIPRAKFNQHEKK